HVGHPLPPLLKSVFETAIMGPTFGGSISLRFKRTQRFKRFVFDLGELSMRSCRQIFVFARLVHLVVGRLMGCLSLITDPVELSQKLVPTPLFVTQVGAQFDVAAMP